MNDNINHPAHYAGYRATIECIDITRHMNFQIGSAFKYAWRAGKKGAPEKMIEDLKKALWYVRDYQEHPGMLENIPSRAWEIFRLIPDSAFDSVPRKIVLEDLARGYMTSNAQKYLENWIEDLEENPEDH